MRSTTFKAVALALLFAGLFVGWLLSIRDWQHRMHPAGTTLAEHLSQRPTAETQRLVDADGTKYLALIGPSESFPRFPSGPPVYLFDASGNLVDWSADEGDDPEFHRRWPNLYTGPLLTPDDVRNWAEAKK
jgi:hypothetical protein